MLKKLAHEANLLTLSRMKSVYFVFIKFNSHLLRICKVAGWELSASSSCTTLLKWVVSHVCFMSMYNSYIEKTSKSIKSNKSTRELTVPVSSLSVFVIDFEQYGGSSLPIKKIKITKKKKWKMKLKKLKK